MGTLEYYPYEMMRKQPYDEAVDVWTIGILIFELAFGSTPFNDGRQDKDRIKQKILSLEFEFPMQKAKVSDQCVDLIARILRPPELRLKLQEVIEHKWFNLKTNLSYKLGERKVPIGNYDYLNKIK